MDTDRFQEALLFAVNVHAEDKRKGTEIPYISHLLAVASLVMEHGGDEDQQIAALLHDAIEDSGGLEMRDIIREKFGERVCALVEACTDAYGEPKPDWRPRKEAFVERVARAEDEALLIVAADKLHNARSILRDYRTKGEKLWERFNAGREGTLWYYRTLTDILGDRCDNALVEELERTVRQIEELAGA